MLDEIEIEIESLDVKDVLHTATDISQGGSIPPLKRLEIMDEDSWEDMTLELVYDWKKNFPRVVRCGGGGDMGRDVIAYNPNGEWENYQCKYYKEALKLDEAVNEIGKIIYYSYKGEYTLPSKYYFVTPQGVKTQLLNHLMDSNKLKKAVLERWNKQCRTKITSTTKIDLDDDLLKYIDSNINFEIFDFIPPILIIDLHSKTPFHAIRFGHERKNRPKPESPPSVPTSSELKYISELFLAFSDAENITIEESNLPEFTEYETEYNSARRNFYTADGLEKFSRDWLPEDCFNELLDECYETISPVVLSEHKNGYIRYLSVSTQAAVTNYSSHPLHSYIKVQDKKGLCHHLVNENKIKWVK